MDNHRLTQAIDVTTLAVAAVVAILAYPSPVSYLTAAVASYTAGAGLESHVEHSHHRMTDGGADVPPDKPPAPIPGALEEAVPDYVWWVEAMKLALTTAIVASWTVVFIGTALGWAVRPPQYAMVTVFLFIIIGWMWGITPGELLKVLR